jgi:two-component system, LytTR family, sensor kinase
MATDATTSSRLAVATSRRAVLGRLPLWVVYLACWLLVGVYQGLNARIGAGDGVATWEPFVWEMSSVVIVLVLAPLVFRLERRFKVDSRPRGRVILAHAGGLLCFSTVHTTAMILLRQLAYAAMGASYDYGYLGLRFFYELQKDVILYGVILVVVFAMREFRVRRASELRAAELAAEVGEARLRQLTAQIEPHFLFNSLNAISNRMHEDVNAADRMMTQLGDLLRAAYESDDSVIVPLHRELAWLRNYMAMMAERFRGKLDYALDVEPGLDAVPVPRLLIQPLVENALKHGLAASGGRLSVTVRRRGDSLEYVVSDDGVGLADAELAHGTGLANVARRLELLFGTKQSLAVTPGTQRGVTVTVRLPLGE